MRTDSRSRNWSFIGYPDDSLPDDYASILSEELHLMWAESPVHDADLNGDGSEKKKHIHFLLVFDGNKSFEQIVEITDRLNCPIPQKCRNVRSLVRYFAHLDNPDKHQYKPTDIKVHGGLELQDYFQPSLTEYQHTLKEIEAFIRDNNITEFCDLCEIVSQMDRDDWYYVISCRNTLYLSQMIRSRKFKSREEVE